MDYEKLLSSVIQLTKDAGELLIAEWQRPNGPRGSVDKAEVDIEIESMLRPGLGIPCALGHPVHEHLDSDSTLTWTLIPRPLGH